jgi:hypothetical protein
LAANEKVRAPLLYHSDCILHLHHVSASDRLTSREL